MDTCGICGDTEQDADGFCINGHDYLVELRDFDNRELVDYLAKAAKRLGLSINLLIKRCWHDV